MNPLPISQAQDADLRLSPLAMARAALRARELAARTGTKLIYGHDGVVEHIRPEAVAATSSTRDSDTHFVASQLVGGFVGVPVSRPD